eukprot:scaffold5723_cov135-Skeletonema_marinoi.AAC.2
MDSRLLGLSTVDWMEMRWNGYSNKICGYNTILTSFVLASIICKLLDRNHDMQIALDKVDMVA